MKYWIRNLRFLGKRWLSIGRKTRIDFSVFIHRAGRGGTISIGDHCTVGRRRRHYWAGYPSQTRLVVWGDDAEIVIGNNCHLNGVSVCARRSVRIADDCLFAAGIQILDSDTHRIDSLRRTAELDDPAPIVLGKNVWVGLNAIILKGTTIGDNCVVGAGAVVKGTFPPDSIIAGNPARVVGKVTVGG